MNGFDLMKLYGSGNDPWGRRFWGSFFLCALSRGSATGEVVTAQWRLVSWSHLTFRETHWVLRAPLWSSWRFENAVVRFDDVVWCWDSLCWMILELWRTYEVGRSQLAGFFVRVSCISCIVWNPFWKIWMMPPWSGGSVVRPSECMGFFLIFIEGQGGGSVTVQN